MDSTGNLVGFNKIADLEPLLVSYCLKKKDGKSISTTEVGKFPAAVQRELFKTAEQMNQLNQEVKMSESLITILDREDSPTSIQEIRDWLETIEEEGDEGKDKLKSVRLLFSPTNEELVKNSLSGTIGGLG